MINRILKYFAYKIVKLKQKCFFLKLIDFNIKKIYIICMLLCCKIVKIAFIKPESQWDQHFHLMYTMTATVFLRYTSKNAFGNSLWRCKD